jgi:argininosuccinate lyase
MQSNTHNKYTVSHHFDRRLYPYDIAGSVAHVRMLAAQDIISNSDMEVIVPALLEIEKEIATGSFVWQDAYEDIHMNIEIRLRDKIGDVAGKLHTGRSRNDQVATDMRMYVKDISSQAIGSLINLQFALLNQGEKHLQTVLPGYTHLQRAQPVILAHHLLAYVEMLERDVQRMSSSYESANSCPLGSGALAGVPYNIDRAMVASELGFSRVTANSMDAVSDRDFVLNYHYASAVCMTHLSRLAEELVLWASAEFGFVELADSYTTGSSMMPQKRNPDFAEIGRGKTGRVYGNLIGLLTTMKGLPLTYNRDLQEDKESLFDTADTLIATLQVFTDLISTCTFNETSMRHAAEESNSLATDIADYLVHQGLAFRDAYQVVVHLTNYCRNKGKLLTDLSLDEFLQFSPLFGESIQSINIQGSIDSRNSVGGTSTATVKQALQEALTRTLGTTIPTLSNTAENISHAP